MPGIGCRDLNLDAVNAFRTAPRPDAGDEMDCPGFSNVDLRFSKFFTSPGSQRVEFIAQLFNVFDRANFDDAERQHHAPATTRSPGVRCLAPRPRCCRTSTRPRDRWSLPFAINSEHYWQRKRLRPYDT